MNLRNKKVDSGPESSAMSNHSIRHNALFEESEVFDANRSIVDIFFFRKGEHRVRVVPAKFCILLVHVYCMRIGMLTLQLEEADDLGGFLGLVFFDWFLSSSIYQ